MARRSRKRRRPTPPRASAATDAKTRRGSDRAAERASRERHAAPPRGRTRYRDPDERPKAPWAPFPLVELVVLLALVLLVAGFAVRGHRGTVMIAAGLVLGTLAGLELSIREHFAGYRSHTALLSGATALAVLIGLTLVVPSVPVLLRLVLALVVFAVAAWALVRVFQRRSGLSFKFR